MTWKERVEDALLHLGGEAHLNEIYDYIESHRESDLSANWKSVVRATLELASSDSDAYTGKDDLFYSAHGLGKGIWGLREFTPTSENMDLTQDDPGFSEGRQHLRQHIVRERNHRVIYLAKQRYLNSHGCLQCEICGFNFAEQYGELGEGFIEGHHIKPVSELLPNEKTKVEDIVLLCSNCHSMIHRRKPWLKKEDIELLIFRD